jgi:hypothetical protein
MAFQTWRRVSFSTHYRSSGAKLVHGQWGRRRLGDLLALQAGEPLYTTPRGGSAEARIASFPSRQASDGSGLLALGGYLRPRPPCDLNATPARGFSSICDGHLEASAGLGHTGVNMFNQASISATGKFADNVKQWASDEFVLRLSEVLALGVSLCVMAVLAFIACAALQ